MMKFELRNIRNTVPIDLLRPLRNERQNKSVYKLKDEIYRSISQCSCKDDKKSTLQGY